MKASSLINEIQKVMEQSGDVDVKIVVMLGGEQVNVSFDPIIIKETIVTASTSVIKVVAQ